MGVKETNVSQKVRGVLRDDRDNATRYTMN